MITHDLNLLYAQKFTVAENMKKYGGSFAQAQDALKEATKCINWTIDTIVKGLDREADIVGCCELTLEKIDDITSITKQDIK